MKAAYSTMIDVQIFKYYLTDLNVKNFHFKLFQKLPDYGSFKTSINRGVFKYYTT